MGLVDGAQGKHLHMGQRLLQMCGVRLFRLIMLLRCLFARKRLRFRKRPTLHGVPEKCFYFPTGEGGVHTELHSLSMGVSKSQICDSEGNC